MTSRDRPARRPYARVSVSNAIASIEGTIAIQYLLNHHIFPIIDANSDGIITAQEIQNFTDTAATKGLAEAGAMARLLGGTSTYAQPETGINNPVFNENPDQPAALQRRFNYFDYLANGQLKGGITIDSFQMLANTLLPQPDSYVIVDRQRASANGFLVDPTAVRNTVNLQHLLPRFMWVPNSSRASWKSLARYFNASPANFGVNRNAVPGTFLPFFTLFNTGPSNVVAGTPVVHTGTAGGQTLSVALTPLMAAPSSTTAATTGTKTTTTTTTTGNTTTSVTTRGGHQHRDSGAVRVGGLDGRQATTAAASPAPTAASRRRPRTGWTRSQAIVDALLKLAGGTAAANAATTSTGLQPAGTLDAGTGVDHGRDVRCDVHSRLLGRDHDPSSGRDHGRDPAAATATPAASTASADATTSPAAAAAANQAQQAKAAKLKAAQASKKSDNFWTKLWKSLK